MTILEQAIRHLRTALDHVEEHQEGCLFCGEGEIVDGGTTPEHQAQCWYYRAQEFLDAQPPRGAED